jgi:hypothetical protein
MANMDRMLSGKIYQTSIVEVRKVTQSAKDEICQISLPVCNHNPETTVFAHLSRKHLIGAGMGYKGKPIGSYACSVCHDVIDGRMKTDFDRDFLWQMELEGAISTLGILFDKGIIKIA